MNIKDATQDFLQYCKNIRLAKSTIKSYTNDLILFEDYLTSIGMNVEKTDVKNITTKHIKDFFVVQQGKYVTSTVRKIRASLSTFYRWIVEEEEYLELNPVMAVRIKTKHESKKQSVVKKDEMAEIMKVFENVPKRRRKFIYYRNKLVIQLLYGCGLRVNELVNLRISDFDESDNSFTVIAKGDKIHKVFLGNEDMLETFKKVVELKRLNNDWLFENSLGGHISTEAVRTIVENCIEDAGIEKRITPHSFRRGCATALIEGGVDISIVKDILGHSDIMTTMRYIQLSEKMVRDTMKNHCPLNDIG